jgi:hypothetical protein
VPDSIPFRRFIPAIFALFAISAALRWSWRSDPIVANIEASYHVLLTVEAMDATPASVHRFLPIVTLGRELDRDVRFGASVRGPKGIYYYTSFAPLGFVAPWAFFHLTGLTPSIEHLLVFNLCIHLAATLLFALLICEIVTTFGVERASQAWIVMMTAATYLFTFEALYSHGVIYWHHSLFQVVWLAQLLSAARALRAAESGQPVRRSDAAVLLLSSLIGPAVEWTGYLASATIAVLFWWRSYRTSRADLRRLGFGVLAGPAIAGSGFVLHFISVIGVDPLVAALKARAGQRSYAHGTYGALGTGYVESYGALLLFVPSVVVVGIFAARRRLAGWLVALIVAAILPLGENLLLTQHATMYHFDRLKALVPMVLLIVVSIAAMPSAFRPRAVFAWLAVFCWCGAGMERSRTIGVAPPMATNDALMQRVASRARGCALYATNAVPRGWVELSFGANAYEAVPSVDSLKHLVSARGACQGLYFRAARRPGEAMYVWQDVAIFDPRTGILDTLDWAAPKRFHKTPLAPLVASR